MEQREQGSRDESAAARSHNAVHVTLREARDVARVLAGTLERRSGGETSDPQVVVVTPTADEALALSRAVAAAEADAADAPLLVPLTAEARARRLLAQRPRAVVAPLAVARALVAQAQLKLASVHTVGLVWIEELARTENRGALEGLLAEVPKEAHRIAFLASKLDPPLEEFLDRAMWRARRVSHVPDLAPADTEVRYVLAAPEHRAMALAATLDALDPASCVLIVTSDEEETAARAAARALGHAGDSDALSVSLELPESEVDLLVFFSEPPDADALRSAAHIAKRVAALVPSSGLLRLRAMAGASARPLLEGDAFAAARSAEDFLRTELRDVLESGAASPHLLVLEPLTAEYDPAEVAAAAVALLRRERQKGRRKVPVARAADEAPAARLPERAAPPATPGRMTRVYLSVGERDGVRRGDLVGAIAGEAEISGAQIGRIELRDSHAVVEVAADVANRVIEKMNGTNIRGRRVLAREDREREGRTGRMGGAGDARGQRGDRRPREIRGRESSERGERGERGERTGRGERASRSFVKARGVRGAARETPRERSGPRAAREASEWSERAERLRNARRAPGAPRRPREGDD